MKLKVTYSLVVRSLIIGGLAFLFSRSALSHVVESTTIKQVLPLVEKHRGKKILVVFDIDNTLVRGVPLFARSEFFTKKEAQMVAAGMAIQDVRHFLYNDYTYILSHTQACLVEQDAPVVFEQLRAAHIDFLGLTSRPMYLSQTTQDQCNALGLTFKFPLTEKTLFYFEDLLRPALYVQGIVYCDVYNAKDTVLLKLFNQLSYEPEVVIVVDDSKGTVIKMEKRMAEKGIIYEGVRLSACDQAVAQFDLEQAEKDLECFMQQSRF